jgi:hypothetical protein
MTIRGVPNFFLIGAMKSGTTALSIALAQHPQVFVPSIKEPNFFAIEGERVGGRDPSEGVSLRSSMNNRADYDALFREVGGELAIGEASHLYLSSERAAQRIHQNFPDAKLIAILRNPAERAYSHYLFDVQKGHRDPHAIAQELREDKAKDSHYLQKGFYFAQLCRYYELFCREQIRVYLYDDFVSDPQGVMEDLYVFLGVESGFVPDTSDRPNASGVPRFRALNKMLTKSNPIKNAIEPILPSRARKFAVWLKNKNLSKPQLPEELRERLVGIYKEDVRGLQELLQRDLSSWLC